MNHNRDVQTALVHHQAGRLDLAENIYRKVLASDPNHADALHLMGALAGQRGRLAEAIDLLQKAISVRPNYIQAIRNLGALLAQAGRYEDSVSTFRKAIELIPEDPSLHNDLGTVLERLNRIDDAIAMFTLATELDPIFAEAKKNLCHVLRKKGKPAEAVEAGSRAVAIAPSSSDAHLELGKALAAAKRPQDALREFREAIRCKPDYIEAFEEIGKTFAQMEKIEEAVAVLKRAIQMQPNNISPHLALGNVLFGNKRLEESLKSFSEALRIDPNSLDAHVNAALVLVKLKRFEEAVAHHVRAVEIAPNAAVTHEAAGEIALQQLDAQAAIEHYRQACAANPLSGSSLVGLGMSLRADGRFEEAQSAFRQALQLDPDMVWIYESLVRAGTRVADETDFERLTMILAEPDAGREERSGAEFALGKTLDEQNRFDEAMAHYIQANLLVKQRREAVGKRYVPESYRNLVDQLVETITPRYFTDRQRWGDSSELPVFIVGMPRSGTTLVHQIAASHPKVHGGGERSDIPKISGDLGGENARNAALAYRRDTILKAATDQMQAYRQMSGDAIRFVDKLPENVIYLGLIALLFPQARVILCRRDPRDTCLSCFFQNFDEGIRFATDMVHCGIHLAETYRLMDHWLKALPLRILEVQYENVVADLDGQARQLIDFLGLPWDSRCLEFQKAQTAVLTSSVWQVRQPIYNSSVGRWRNYESHIAPLLKALETVPKDQFRQP